MVDFLGPGAFNCARPAATRPTHTPGNLPGDLPSWFKDCSSPLARDGTEWRSSWLNHLIANLRSLVGYSGVPLTNLDDDVITRAVRQFGGEYYVAGGTANALTITPSLAFANNAQMNGVPIRVRITATNTGPATLQGDPITRFDGSPLAAKDMVDGDIAIFIRHSVTNSFRLQSPRSVVGRGCLCVTSIASAYGSGVEGAIEFNQEVYDTDNIHSLTGSLTRLTVPAGVSTVVLGAQVAWEPNTTGSRKWRVLQNGASEGAGRPAARVPNAGGADITVASSVGWEISVSPGDYFELLQVQDSGIALPIRTGGNTWFGMKIIR